MSADGSTTIESGDERRVRALGILRRHGRDPFAFQTLAPGLFYWFDPEADAFVAYADTGHAWVAAGAPVAPRCQVADVADRFLREGRDKHRRVRFFGVEADFAEHGKLAALRVGQDPVWDPRGWDDRLRESKSLREQLRRSKAKGVGARVLASREVEADDELRAELVDLANRWLATRRMAPMGFLLTLDPFELVDERTYVAAEREGEVLALLVAAPIHERDGWLVEHIFRRPDAPNGTTELAIDAFMREAAGRGSHHVSLGLAPLAGPVAPWLRVARRLGRVLYNFEGLYAFKAKLRPDRWEPIYLAYPRSGRAVGAVVDTLSAFATGSFLRFAAATARHLRRPITGVLAALLVPFTGLVALADPAWFPSATVKWTWVGFYAVLLLLLSSLLRSWRRWLVGSVTVLAVLDVACSLLQLVAYNARRPPVTGSPALDWLLMISSLLAPLFAVLFFGACLLGRERTMKLLSRRRPSP